MCFHCGGALSPSTRICPSCGVRIAPEDESHRFYQFFTLITLLLGIPLLAVYGGGLILIVPSVWLLRRTRSFKIWSTLPDGTRALGGLIMVPGVLLGGVVLLLPLIIYAAWKAEFS